MIQIINKRRPSNTIGDAITAATQGFIQGQDLRGKKEERDLARAKYDLEMQKLQSELQPVDPSSDLVADPQGTGMFYSKREGKWINPRAQSTNINLGGILGGAFEEPQPIQSQDGEMNFNSQEEADNSGLPARTRVKVNGRPYEI